VFRRSWVVILIFYGLGIYLMVMGMALSLNSADGKSGIGSVACARTGVNR